jgi:hypothetical protein
LTVAEEESSPLYAAVVAAVAFVKSSAPVSCSLPPSVPGRCTVLTGARVATLVVGLVVSDAATDATDATFLVVVAVGGGSFKLAREGSVCLKAVDANDTDVRAVLEAAVFLLGAAERLLFARGRVMLLSGMAVGIAGQSYYCEVLGCKIMGEWMVGSDLW